jgi:hypothetical protein
VPPWGGDGLGLKLSEDGAQFRVLSHMLGNRVEARGVGLEPIRAWSPAEHDGEVGVDEAFLVTEEVSIALCGLFHLQPHFFSCFIRGCAEFFAGVLGFYPAFGMVAVKERWVDGGDEVDGPAVIKGECGIIGRGNDPSFVFRIQPLADRKAFTHELIADLKRWYLKKWVDLLIVAFAEFSPLQPLESVGHPKAQQNDFNDGAATASCGVEFVCHVVDSSVMERFCEYRDSVSRECI